MVSRMQSLEQTFRALADRTRLRILCILRGGETCVGDLVQVLGVSQPVASRHLAYLRRAGLVRVRRVGLWAFYSIVIPSGDFENSLLHCIDAAREESPELQEDVGRAALRRQAGGCCPEQGLQADAACADPGECIR